MGFYSRKLRNLFEFTVDFPIYADVYVVFCVKTWISHTLLPFIAKFPHMICRK